MSTVKSFPLAMLPHEAVFETHVLIHVLPRVTPGHGYLDALGADNVQVHTDVIVKAVPEGLVLQDGTVVELDSLVCATGFDTSFCPPFPVIGIDGKDLRDEWKVEPRSYLGIGAHGFPNYFSKYNDAHTSVGSHGSGTDS
jgi:cation diffusion facilitator CzcD-associated flavoprotein CzcO